METQTPYEAAPATNTDAGNNKPKQLNVELSADLMGTFTRYCDKRGLSKRQVVEQLVDRWCVAQESGNTYHMDGTECPLSKFFADLADTMNRRDYR